MDEFVKERVWRACQSVSQDRMDIITAYMVSVKSGYSESTVYRVLRLLKTECKIHQRYKHGPYHLGPAPSSDIPSAPRGGEDCGDGFGG